MRNSPVIAQVASAPIAFAEGATGAGDFATKGSSNGAGSGTRTSRLDGSGSAGATNYTGATLDCAGPQIRQAGPAQPPPNLRPAGGPGGAASDTMTRTTALRSAGSATTAESIFASTADISPGAFQGSNSGEARSRDGSSPGWGDIRLRGLRRAQKWRSSMPLRVATLGALGCARYKYHPKKRDARDASGHGHANLRYANIPRYLEHAGVAP